MNSRTIHLRTLLASFVFALCLSFSAAAQTIPPGSYSAVFPQTITVGNLTFLSGEYQLVLLEGGKYRLGRNDFINLTGTYTVTGNQVRFASPATMDTCSGEGAYQFAVAGNRLTLTAATARVDSCVERIVNLTTTPFFRNDPAVKDWRSIGPTGGLGMFAILPFNGKIYAASQGGGVFISADNGQTWRAAYGIKGNTVFALAAFNNTLFAGTNAGRVFFSTDGGETWERPLVNIVPTSLVYDFVESGGRLYAATVGDGVWRMGASPYQWEKTGTAGLTNQNVFTLAASGNNLFAGTDGGGIFVSTNGGANWTALNNGLSILRIRALAVDGGKLYASSAFGSPTTTPNEVFVSENNGANWQRLGNGIASYFPAGLSLGVYEMLPRDGKLFAAATHGILIWDGTKWNQGHQGSPVFSFYSIAASGNTLFAGSFFDGVARSLDGGATFTNANVGLNARRILSVHRDSGVLYAGVNDGAFLSRDEGQTWERINTTALASHLHFLSFNGKVYAGVGNGIFVTEDQGRTWARVGPPSNSVTRLRVVNGVLYATVFNTGVSRSTDGGTTWAMSSTGLGSLQLNDLTNIGTTLFVATSNLGIFRSTDGGQSWAAANNGLPAGTAFTIVAINDVLLTSVFGTGVYRSTDNGQTWAPTAGVSIAVISLYAGGGNVYASGDGGYGVLRSTNEGRSFQLVNAGFDSRFPTNFFASGGTVYVGSTNGVYASNSLVNRTATVSAASFRTTLADKSIAAAFGAGLASRTEAAASLPLPTNLAGTTVRVRDALGVERLVPLFFVSAGQINYQIPAGTAAGLASITITNADGIGATGEFNVVATAPAVFTASANGTGAAIAVDALTGAAGPFNATQANGQPNIIAVFGTGLGADATDLDANVNATVTATIGGRAAPVLYAGRAPGFAGANQFNITLPAGLAAGTYPLVITRGGAASNSVTIAIR